MVSQEEKVVDYYKNCDIDYQLAWRDRKSLGMHFGLWEKYTWSHSKSLLNQNIFLAEMANISKDDVILDAGCGIGGAAFWLANNFSSKVIGISLSDNQIELAKRLSKTKDKKGLTSFQVQDYNKTNFEAETFTVIWAQESLPHADDKFKFLKEAFRLLKPGGKLIASDYFLSKENYTEDEEKLLNKWLDGWAMTNFLTKDEFIKLTKEAGFKDIKHEDTTDLVKLSIIRLYHSYVISLPIAKILQLLGLRNDVQKKNNDASKYAYKSFMNGLWHHGITLAVKPYHTYG